MNRSPSKGINVTRSGAKPSGAETRDHEKFDEKAKKKAAKVVEKTADEPSEGDKDKPADKKKAAK